MAKTRATNINLGELQQTFQERKEILTTDTVALAKAQENFRRSRSEYNIALDDLQDGVNAVING